MASKNIVAKGTTYNGVESVTFPVSGGGNATFYEISDTTAIASDVLNSKYFYTSSGVKTQGTGTAPSPTLITKSITANGTYDAEDDDADGYSSVTVSVSGGGSGLIVESGTFEPSSDNAHPTISFANTHSTLPVYVIIYDSTGTSNSADDNLYWSIINFYELYSGINLPNGTYWYARTQGAYASSSTGTGAGNNITSLSGSTTSSLPYYLTTSEFSPWVNNTRYFRSGRTYTWKAVWKPTT